MLRPACHEVQFLFHQALKVPLSSISCVRWQNVTSVCRGCQRQFSTTRKQAKKFHDFWSQSFTNLERRLSSKSGSKNGTSDDLLSQTKMAAASPSSQGQAGSSSQDVSKSSGPATSTPGIDSKSSPKVLAVKPRPRKASLDYSYTGNIYILPVRAMNEYLLKPSDLEGLPKYTRRSPYEYGPKITMYLRSDVDEVAKKVWGSLENLNKEKNKLLHKERYIEDKHDYFHLRSLIDSHKERLSHRFDDRTTGDDKMSTSESFWKQGSAKVVMSAIFVNGLNSIIKFVAWLYTGSHSMFSEFVHSVADTVNQIILGLGLYHSIKKPDPDHPYGYRNLRHISSLISGVGIFCLGTGLSWYHGIQGFMYPEQMGSLTWGIGTLFGALVSEGATLIVAVNQVKKSSRAKNMKFWQYVLRGDDPNVTVVLLEDLAAVVGVGIAAVCMGVTHYTGNSFADSLGSMLIGGLLGIVATFIIRTNTAALVGRSIPVGVQQQINQELERDRMIRSVHDIKAMEMSGQVRFKAEVDFDGREITRAYLYKLDLEQLLAEMQELQHVEDVEAFMLNHGERIVDMLGGEVDRIEKILKELHPELRHVDLEAL